MPSAIFRDQRGFSLIEALIAMVLLSIGLLGTGLLQIGGIKANANAAGRTSGVAVAQLVMDELRSCPQDDPLLVDGGGSLDSGRATGGSAPNPAAADQRWNGTGVFTASDGRTYTVFWNVSDGVPLDGIKTVRLFVYWNDSKFGLNKVVMTTVLGGYYL